MKIHTVRISEVRGSLIRTFCLYLVPARLSLINQGVCLGIVMLRTELQYNEEIGSQILDFPAAVACFAYLAFLLLNTPLFLALTLSHEVLCL